MKISIVIPTLNHLDDLLKPCIEGLKAQTDFAAADAEVIVVANGCKDGTRDFVESLGPPFKLLSFPEPMGYTKAMNAGVCAASGEFVVPFNNDIVLLDWGKKNIWLEIMGKPFEGDPKVAITGPSRMFRAHKPFIVFYCCMIRRKLILEAGMLDEIFSPGAGEDTDFCMKVLEKGYKVVQVPHEGDDKAYLIPFPIWHKGGSTVNEVPGWPDIIARNEKILQSRYGMGTSLS